MKETNSSVLNTDLTTLIDSISKDNNIDALLQRIDNSKSEEWINETSDSKNDRILTIQPAFNKLIEVYSNHPSRQILSKCIIKVINKLPSDIFTRYFLDENKKISTNCLLYKLINNWLRPNINDDQAAIIIAALKQADPRAYTIGSNTEDSHGNECALYNLVNYYINNCNDKLAISLINTAKEKIKPIQWLAKAGKNSHPALWFLLNGFKNNVNNRNFHQLVCSIIRDKTVSIPLLILPAHENKTILSLIFECISSVKNKNFENPHSLIFINDIIEILHDKIKVSLESKNEIPYEILKELSINFNGLFISDPYKELIRLLLNRVDSKIWFQCHTEINDEGIEESSLFLTLLGSMFNNREYDTLFEEVYSKYHLIIKEKMDSEINSGIDSGIEDTLNYMFFKIFTNFSDQTPFLKKFALYWVFSRVSLKDEAEAEADTKLFKTALSKASSRLKIDLFQIFYNKHLKEAWTEEKKSSKFLFNYLVNFFLPDGLFSENNQLVTRAPIDLLLYAIKFHYSKFDNDTLLWLSKTLDSFSSDYSATIFLSKVSYIKGEEKSNRTLILANTIFTLAQKHSSFESQPEHLKKLLNSLTELLNKTLKNMELIETIEKNKLLTEVQRQLISIDTHPLIKKILDLINKSVSSPLTSGAAVSTSANNKTKAAINNKKNTNKELASENARASSKTVSNNQHVVNHERLTKTEPKLIDESQALSNNHKTEPKFQKLSNNNKTEPKLIDESQALSDNHKTEPKFQKPSNNNKTEPKLIDESQALSNNHKTEPKFQKPSNNNKTEPKLIDESQALSDNHPDFIANNNNQDDLKSIVPQQKSVMVQTDLDLFFVQQFIRNVTITNSLSINKGGLWAVFYPVGESELLKQLERLGYHDLEGVILDRYKGLKEVKRDDRPLLLSKRWADDDGREKREIATQTVPDMVLKPNTK